MNNNLENPGLVDSHCHLNLIDYQKLDCDTDDVLQNAKEAGVTHMLCVSVDLEHFNEVLALAKTHNQIYASLGVHPNTPMDTPLTEEDLLSRCTHSKIIAIGETGLDYYRSEGDLEWQQERFRCHIRVAQKVKKPIIVHCRDAKTDTIAILNEEQADSVGGVMHCFVDDWETAKAALDLNFYISFSGIVTFKSATDLKEVAKKMPLDRILVETDSPYLAPVPYRGKTNQPAYVQEVAKYIAELRGVKFEKIAEQTTANFFSLFLGNGSVHP
ncbi:Uncharacterized metal-dependent hydrolase YcfH [hydrothermal vent metagenome]|uniref:Uncharacterized metal-dependent hydrolase YcfH n=1 Tax=hydrothermal vent metagenome TaxID=652676 RepID=A0A3B0Z9L6_9ZZZZ